jgi:hypothetical protein
MIWLLIIVAIILAIVYWYITIPLIAIGVIWFYKDNIKKKLDERKTKKYYKNYYHKQQGEKLWNLIDEFSISNSEAEKIFGNDFMLNYPTRKLYLKCISIANDPLQFTKIPKYLILKLSNIFDRVSDTYSFESFTKNYYHTSKSWDQVLDEITRTQNTFRTIFQNYENFVKDEEYEEKNSYRNSNSYQYDDYSNNNYQENNKRQQNNDVKQKRIQDRLRKFRISEADAEVIFGKRWKSILGKPEWKFFYDVWGLDIKITYDYNGRYKKKFGNLYSKVIEIIRIVDEENPRMAAGKNRRNGYSWSEHSWYGYDFSSNSYDDDYQYDESQDSGYQEFNENNIDDEKISWAYAIMELNPNSTAAEIKTRYRELALKYHPDRNKSPDSTKKMSEIINAYEVLTNVVGAA